MTTLNEVRVAKCSSPWGKTKFDLRDKATDKRVESGFDAVEKALAWAEKNGYTVIGKYAPKVVT